MKDMKNKAFTLVELIIVIAVIGVLAAILIPVFSNVIDKSNEKSALSDAKNAMTQVITEAAEKTDIPENILIVVEKASKFYLYGFNTTDNHLKQSKGNAFTGYADFDELVSQASWNGLKSGIPEIGTEYTDTESYGYFYLVPYADGVSQAPTIKGYHSTKSPEEYLEISDISKGFMTENMGDKVHIYHGFLLNGEWTELDGKTQSASNQTPQPSQTPADTDVPLHTYHMLFWLMDFDCSYVMAEEMYYNLEYHYTSESIYMWKMDLELSPGHNEVALSDINWPEYKYNENYKVIAVEKGDLTLKPLKTIDIVIEPYQVDTNTLIRVPIPSAIVPNNWSETGYTLEEGERWVVFDYWEYDERLDTVVPMSHCPSIPVPVKITCDIGDITEVSIDELISKGRYTPYNQAGEGYQYLNAVTFEEETIYYDVLGVVNLGTPMLYAYTVLEKVPVE